MNLFGFTERPWRNWQTRRLQVPVSARTWRFESSRPQVYNHLQKTWTVYALQCSDGSIYIGMTNNLNRRIKEHQAAQVSWTKSRLPIRLIHQETLMTRIDARKREKYLKSGWGKQWLKSKLGIQKDNE